MPRKGYGDVLEKDPTKTVSREEAIGRTVQKLNEADKRALRIQIEQKEEEIRAKKDMNPQADVSDMQKEINDKKMIIQHDDDLTPKSDNHRDRLDARRRELETMMTANGMCTKREMWPGTNDPLKMRYVKKNGDWQDRFASEILEWKDIKNKLEPDDPNAASLELIRPD